MPMPPRRPSTSRGAAPPQKEEGHRINNRIDAREVRLIDAAGENVGVVPIRQAIMMAEEASLDLVEISPDAKPPVCKILDYGKFKFQEQKKKNEVNKTDNEFGETWVVRPLQRCYVRQAEAALSHHAHVRQVCLSNSFACMPLVLEFVAAKHVCCARTGRSSTRLQSSSTTYTRHEYLFTHAER